MSKSSQEEERVMNSWSLGRSASAAFAFLLGMAVMMAYTQFTIKSQITSTLDSRERGTSLDANAVKRLHKRSTGETNDGRARTKRHASVGPSAASAHLIGETGRTYFQRPLNGGYFRWSHVNRNSFSLMEIEEDNTGTFIVINRSGYYMVYSQVTYNGHGTMLIGHETVRIAGRYQHSLMTTLKTQQLATPRSGNVAPRSSAGRSIDSGYQAGVFFLHERDRIGVKPTRYGVHHTYTMGSKGSFFGLYFIHD